MAKFEYVASGLGYTKMFNSFYMEDDNIEITKSYFKSLNAYDHDFSVLFNAFQEPSYGEKLNTKYRDAIKNIHADSGGLQMITQGRQITEEAKDKIYKVQAEYSNIAMSFDEIPIKSTVEKAVIGADTYRRFDAENLKEYAKKSGLNLKRQLEVFADEKTTSKPIMIIQGNGYESFIEWHDELIKQIPSSMRHMIGGISISAAAHGSKVLESTERAFTLGELLSDEYNNTCHILGIGNISTMLPYLIALRTGAITKDAHISYDSTSHTGNLGRRRLTTNKNKTIATSKIYNPNWDKVFKVMIKHYPELLTHVPDSYKLFDILENRDKYEHGEYLHASIAFFASNVLELTSTIQKCNESQEKLYEVANLIKSGLLCHNLLTLRDTKDFIEWRDEYGKHFKSSKIKKLESSSTLDDFFV